MLSLKIKLNGHAREYLKLKNHYCRLINFAAMVFFSLSEFWLEMLDSFIYIVEVYLLLIINYYLLIKNCH